MSGKEEKKSGKKQQSAGKTTGRDAPVSEAVKKRRRQKAELTKDNRLVKSSRSMYVVAGIFAALFIFMAGYLCYFTVAKSADVTNNSYNVRLQEKEEDVIRGTILASGGEVLATTNVDENGNTSRVYPYGSVFAHAVGYATVGTTGLEQMANPYVLNSENGDIFQDLYYELNGVENSYVGETVVSTLDVAVQQAAYDALSATGCNGAVIALEPSTGKILSMVSIPDYDPNTIADIWEDLVNAGDGDSRLVNRATQGLYPPGSTFKILTTLEYMRENPDYIDGQVLYTCTGSLSGSVAGEEYADLVINCSEGTAHGAQSLRTALASSCNGFFATIGLDLNTRSFASMCDDFLFNKSIPVSMEYKKSSFSLSISDSDWEKMQTMFGQGETLVTPMHMAMIAAAIANGGTMMTPMLIDSVLDAEGEETLEVMKPASCAEPMTEEEAEMLTSYMISVVNDGTGYLTQSDAYQAACKTGSAEYDDSGNTHAWYIGFAPADDPQIAVAVIVEGGGSGGRVAGPIAKAVFDACLLN